MPKIKSGEKGFTLIEVIVTLILVGITASLAGMWIVSVANGYVFAKLNAKTAQNGQLAMARLVKEFTIIKSVTSPTSATTGGIPITYTRTDDSLGTVVTRSVGQSGEVLQIQQGGTWYTLADSVSTNGGFTLTYCDNANSTNCPSFWSSTSTIIEIKLKLKGANGIESEFTQRVAPRNL
jgi:prepilin-type N-terminal cleavage/methylation domain-containing protein